MSTLKRNTHTPATSESSGELEARIRQRAYELYEERGREDGHDWEDWLAAKAQVEAANKDAA